MERLAQQLTSLSPEQRRLVEHWLRQQQTLAAAPPPSNQIPRRRATDVGTLSFAQQRLWLLYQLEPQSPAYNLRTIVRLVGRLDSVVLARSLNAIVQRHEGLRTTFTSEAGRPRQVIAPAFALPMPLIALDALPHAQQEAQVSRLAIAETEQPFDLARGPLLRVCLLRLATDEHVLLLTMHHIISDGWSQGVQLRELMALYTAFLAGKPSPLPELPIQYADYALWQRQSFQDAKQDKQLIYWKEQIGRTAHVLELPTDRPRPAVATYRGAWEYYTLPASLLDGLKELSRRAGVTLFMTLLAAFDVLLYRVTGQTDLVLGTPVAGRNRSELEGLIGCFINMLALRTNLSGNPSFRELLQRVRTVTLGAYAHQDLPIEKLIDDLQHERDMSRNAIFQVMFVLQNMPMPTLNGADLTLLPLDITSTSSILDLSLYAREVEHEVLLRAEYNTDLFDAVTIRRMLGHFHMLLEGIVADPDQHLCALPLLTEPERRQLPLVEEALADVWASMLGLERVERHDDFFAVGGQPLKAAQLIVRIRDTFHVNLLLRNLAEAPTVAAMAELLIAHETKPGRTEQIARMLTRLKHMPVADRQKMLEQKRKLHSRESYDVI